MNEHPQRSRGLLAILAGVLALGLFWSVGLHRLDGYQLGVGSIGLPRARMIYFIAYWTFFGGLAVLLAAVGAASVADAIWGWGDQGTNDVSPPRTRTVVLVAAGLAVVFPVLVRIFILEGAPVTDDESAYRFMAELIATGRLTVESPPPGVKLFFDRFQMVNGGERFAQYFVGWPALMAPGVWLGVEEWMNPIYAAATVPPLVSVARRLGDRWTGLAAATLFLASPFLVAGAATLGAHTSCIAALAWTYWAFFRTRDDANRVADHALFATAFSIAFFIRPLAAAGLGAPLLVAWATDRFRNGATRWRTVAAFGIPAVLFAAAFLGVNYVQTGAPFDVAYRAFLEYSQQNGGRFTGEASGGSSGIPNLALSGLVRAASLVGNGLFRFDAALFGWPVSLVFVLFAGFDRRTRLIWLSATGFLVTRFLLQDAGIDLFGPVHFAELAVPAILLSAVGITRATQRLAGTDFGDVSFPFGGRALWPAAAVAAAIVAAGLCYLPVRFGALSRVAANTKIPRVAAQRAGLGDAVVFAPRPFVPNCLGSNARHFVYWRPLNDPDLRSKVLWVNHVSVEEDRKLMRYAPNRTGYVLAWSDGCTPHFVPLSSERAARVPDGHIGGTGEGPDWSRAPSPKSYRLPDPR